MKEMEFAAEDGELQNATDFITGCVEKECSPAIMMKLEISIEEIFVNISHYAYRDSEEKPGKVRIRCSVENDFLEMTFIDRGTPYNPLEKEDPDITLNAQERPIGGLGIFMVKKYMHDMHYEHADGENRLTLVMKLA